MILSVLKLIWLQNFYFLIIRCFLWSVRESFFEYYYHKFHIFCLLRLPATAENDPRKSDERIFGGFKKTSDAIATSAPSAARSEIVQRHGNHLKYLQRPIRTI